MSVAVFEKETKPVLEVPLGTHVEDNLFCAAVVVLNVPEIWTEGEEFQVGDSGRLAKTEVVVVDLVLEGSAEDRGRTDCLEGVHLHDWA